MLQTMQLNSNRLNELHIDNHNKANLLQHYTQEASQLQSQLQEFSDSELSAAVKTQIQDWLQEADVFLHAEASNIPDDIPQKVNSLVIQGQQFSFQLSAQVLEEPLMEFEPSAPERNQSNKNNTNYSDMVINKGNPVINSNLEIADGSLKGNFNLFSVLISVATITTQMSIHGVSLQNMQNTIYSQLINDLQDAQNLFTQVSAAFKQAAANANLFGGGGGQSTNFGFTGVPSVPFNSTKISSSVATERAGSNFNDIISSMSGGLNGSGASWTLADYLAMYKVSTFREIDSSGKVTGNVSFYYSNDSVTRYGQPTSKDYQTKDWASRVLKDTNQKVYLGIGSDSPSSYLQKYSYQYDGNATLTSTGQTPPTVSSMNAVNDSTLKSTANGFYFISQDGLSNLIADLGKRCKSVGGTDFAELNSDWFAGSSQCDGLLNTISGSISNFQSKANGNIQQISLLSQNSTTQTNSILSAFQALTNALMKL